MSHDVVEAVEPTVIVLEVAQVVGPRGPAGEDGAPGLDGAPGDRGPEGPQGEDGPRGADGPRGLTGAPGVDGEEGPRGPAGDRGPDGREGPRGEPGRDGEDGAPGRDGVDGETGPPGTDGLPGAPGRDGVDGLPGRDGLDGRPGADGAPGRDGLDGAPGEQGERGPAGPGLPAGGTIGQVATKASAADHDVTWATPTGGGGGGSSDADVAEYVTDAESATRQALAAAFVTSDQVRRIVVSANPSEPISANDLLIVKASPRVTLRATSPQTEIPSGSSVTVTIPPDIRQGDLLVLCVGHAHGGTVNTPSGFALVASAQSVLGTAGLTRVAMFTKTATGTEGGQALQVSQTVAGRLWGAVSALVSDGPISLITHAAAASDSTPHPIGKVTSTARGQLALHFHMCTYTGSAYTLGVPSGWIALTPTGVGEVRAAVLYSLPRSGDALSGALPHSNDVHWGASITALFGAA